MSKNSTDFDFSSWSAPDDRLPEEILHAIERIRIAKKSEEIAAPVASFLYITKQCINRLDSKLLDKEPKPNKDEISNYTDVIQSLIRQRLEELEGFHEEDFVLRYKKESINRILTKIRSLNDPYIILGFEYVLDQILAEEKVKADFDKLASEEKVELSDLYDSVTIANIENSLSK